uniref:Uncharacterized protein n=1 Tax=viral metagenome TaxID=1070528 RepID=A0A6C0K2M2_9ZZZZ
MTSSRTRVKLLLALEKDRELDSSPQISPDSVSSKTSSLRKKLDSAFDQEYDLMAEMVSNKVEKQIRQLKVQELMKLDEESMFQRIQENYNKGKTATAQLYV